MPPAERVVPRHAAEPPQETAPYGRWAERLSVEFLAACQRVATEGQEIGDPGEISWYPDRSWHGRTYVPASCRTSADFELYGYVRYVTPSEDREPSEFDATADFTDETAERNPDWRLDLCDEVIGSWRGENGSVAAMTLVWGRALVSGGVVATAELADLAVDQCTLDEDRFTLIAPDDYRGDFLEVKLFSQRGDELARESLYAE